jgi:hypothetical protein
VPQERKTRSSPVWKGKRSGGNTRKLRRPDEAARQKAPPVSFKTKRIRAKTFARVEGNHQRTALRRLFKKKYALIALENLDQRTHAFQRFRSIVRGVSNDLGGIKRLSTIEKALVQAFASATIRAEDLSARQLLGEELVDFSILASAISSMIRVAKRLGVERRPREIVPLNTYLNSNGKTEDVVEAEIIDD